MEMLETNKLKEIYKGKKVFLTGHTGFKGSWLLLILKELGAITKGYALDPQYKNDLYNLIKGDEHCTSIIDDIRNKEKIKQEILNFKPNFIFHMAAQALVIKSYTDPLFTYETNVLGTAYILDSLRFLNHKCHTIIITTDKVYENIECIKPYEENERLGGFDPYSNSKACAELISSSYRNSFFNISQYKKHQKSIATVRSGNVIGGGDWSDNRIIPDLIKAIQNDKKLIIRNPNSIRPWQHVLDPLFGYLTLGMKLNENPTYFSQAFNFGPQNHDTLTVEELIKIAISITKKGSYKIEKENNHFHEANLLSLSIQKSKKELNWQPKYDSKIAIQKTIEWYNNYQNNPLKITQNQIKEFINY